MDIGQIIGKNIINATGQVKNIEQEIDKFKSYKLFIVIASAISIGLATHDVITKIMEQAILPIIVYFADRSLTHFLYKYAVKITTKYELISLLLKKFGKIIWLILVWLIVVYITYIFFNHLIKIDILTNQANLVEDVTRYLTNQEKSQRINQEQNNNSIYLF